MRAAPKSWSKYTASIGVFIEVKKMIKKAPKEYFNKLLGARAPKSWSNYTTTFFLMVYLCFGCIYLVYISLNVNVQNTPAKSNVKLSLKLNLKTRALE